MVRVKRGFVARKRRKKLLKRAKGFRGSLSKLFRPSKQAVIRAMSYATAHRRKRKGDMRALWIIRINIAARQCGLTYGRFMNGLKKANILIDRKMLAEMAVNDSIAFKKLVESIKAAPADKPAKTGKQEKRK
ncbi:MAG: 50S ribosomal protein L20 [bacterium]